MNITGGLGGGANNALFDYECLMIMFRGALTNLRFVQGINGISNELLEVGSENPVCQNISCYYGD